MYHVLEHLQSQDQGARRWCEAAELTYDWFFHCRIVSWIHSNLLIQELVWPARRDNMSPP